MIELLVVWFCLLMALIVFAIGRPRQPGALTLAYFIGMSLIHVPGAFVYAWDPNLQDAEPSLIGFELTVLGFAAFALGAIVGKIMLGRKTKSLLPGEENISAHKDLRLRLSSLNMVVIGIAIYFGVMPISRDIPSATAVLQPFSSLLILGLWVRLYASEYFSAGRYTLPTLAIALPVMPIATLAAQGIINYGVSWTISTASFLFIMYRRRSRVYVFAPVVVFLGMSMFVTYMGQRDVLRELIWQQQAGISARLNRISDMITQFHIVNFKNFDDQTAILIRLNQNFFVGSAVQRHESGLSSFAYGTTVQPSAFIPRVFWPDKPEIGGGRSVVADFTGLVLSTTSSWGAGQTLEFYINFGVIGVFVGFFGLGFLLMWLDHGLMSALSKGDVREMLIFGLPGLTLLQPGGNLLEIMVGAVAAVLVAFTASFFFQRIETTQIALGFK